VLVSSRLPAGYLFLLPFSVPSLCFQHEEIPDSVSSLSIFNEKPLTLIEGVFFIFSSKDGTSPYLGVTLVKVVQVPRFLLHDFICDHSTDLNDGGNFPPQA